MKPSPLHENFTNIATKQVCINYSKESHRAFGPSLPPKMYWERTKFLGSKLGCIAVRLFNTIANSVPSERAFSCHHLIHDARRKRLTPETADQLAFILMNVRVFTRIYGNTGLTRLSDLSLNDVVDLENDMYARISVW